MDATQTSTPNSSPSVPVPPGFLTIEQIQQLPSQALKDKQKVNVIGFLKDFQPPIRSQGTDFKCTIDIVDSSLPYGSFGIKANIFWNDKDDMPKIDGVGDAVLFRNIRVQMWAGTVSLLSHLSTEVHVLVASKIPKALPRSLDGLWRSYLSKRQRPTDTETTYVIEARARIDDLALPSTSQFQERSMQAMNVKNKFALLKDVKPGGFYDILGEVIRVYGETFDSATVYLSDYTPNSLFYNYPWAEAQTSNGRDGDEHGYLKSRPKAAKDVWTGPYGKMTIQLTLWDGHAAFVKEQVRLKSWVLLRNVQIKFGKSGQHLEGFLRGDKNAIEGKIQVEVMERSEEPDDNDSRWKEAIARKYDWEKKFKQQKQAILDEADGTKRKREDGPCKGNSKSRRKERRAAGLGKAATTEAKVMKKLDLNENIRSSNPDEPTVPLAEVLKVRKLPSQAGSDRRQTSPFQVCKYKANVRVVGYFPPKVEDFAVGHRPSEFDMLSDYSGGEDTDPEEDMRAYRSGKGFPKKIWEWRFALEVIDASDKISGERMWLMVENQDAQMLLNMDATNLRKDADALQAVKEQLCVLWGDLEEQKSALARTNTLKSHTPLSMEPKSSPPPYHKPGDQPPIDSDDEDQNARKRRVSGIKPVNAGILSERDSNITTKAPPSAAADQKASAELQIKNKGFTCCIKQYGVKVTEDDPSLANAGNGKRWQRKFGLFGTQIV